MKKNNHIKYIVACPNEIYKKIHDPADYSLHKKCKHELSDEDKAELLNALYDDDLSESYAGETGTIANKLYKPEGVDRLTLYLIKRLNLIKLKSSLDLEWKVF